MFVEMFLLAFYFFALLLGIYSRISESWDFSSVVWFLRKKKGFFRWLLII